MLKNAMHRGAQTGCPARRPAPGAAPAASVRGLAHLAPPTRARRGARLPLRAAAIEATEAAAAERSGVSSGGGNPADAPAAQEGAGPAPAAGAAPSPSGSFPWTKQW
jgi:hypothetical protein